MDNNDESIAAPTPVLNEEALNALAREEGGDQALNASTAANASSLAAGANVEDKKDDIASDVASNSSSGIPDTASMAGTDTNADDTATMGGDTNTMAGGDDTNNTTMDHDGAASISGTGTPRGGGGVVKTPSFCGAGDHMSIQDSSLAPDVTMEIPAPPEPIYPDVRYDTLHITGVERLNNGHIYQIFNLIPNTGVEKMVKFLNFVADDIVCVEFMSQELCKLAFQALENYDRFVPHAENEMAGVFRARNNHLQVRYANDRDQPPRGFKRKMRSGKITREFRQEVKEGGVFFQTPKAAIATGNMPEKKIQILWEDEESSDEEMEPEDPKEPKPEKDILDILMKVDRKIYRHIKKKNALSTLYKLQEEQRENTRAYQKAIEEQQARQQKLLNFAQRQNAAAFQMPFGFQPAFPQPHIHNNWADTHHYEEVGEDDMQQASKRQRIW